MTGAGKGKKRYLRMSRQISLVLTVFYLILMMVSLYIIRYSSTNTYLAAKNDMIERDINYINELSFSSDSFAWYLDYWRQHPDEVKKEITTDEIALAADAQIYGLVEMSETEALDALSPEVQLAVAKDAYSRLENIFKSELEEKNYGCLFIVGIGEENGGFVYAQQNSSSDINTHILGEQWSGDFNNTPISQRFISGKYNDVEFDVSSDEEFKDQKYYIGALPLVNDGEVVAALCIGYNWDGFYTDLVNELKRIALIMTVGVLIIYLLMMLIINRIAARPLAVLQSAVRDYTETNNSRSVVEKIKTIHSKNEIGELSYHFRDLITQVDDHIKEIQHTEREKAELSNELLTSLVQTIDAKDKYTNGHSIRVAMYSRMLASRLGFDDKECDKIYRMGLLHDIGKIGVPNDIINKRSRLDDEEYMIIKSHTLQGHEILKRIKSFPELAEAARWHHERFDGKGYPDKLKGPEVPLEIRIISVADSYDAMTSNRSYRSFLPQEVVKSELEKYSGTQFDPSVAQQMLQIMDEDKDYQLHEFNDDTKPKQDNP